MAAVAGRRDWSPDPAYELALSQDLQDRHGRDELLTLFHRFSHGSMWFDGMMRRVCLRALVQRCGAGLQVGMAVCLRHPETLLAGGMNETTKLQKGSDMSCSMT